MNRILSAFTAHPASVDETYFEHMRFAGWFAGTLFLAASAALIHAILPFLFDKTASRIVARLYDRTHNRGAPQGVAAE
ncbi:MAG: hypothetical protein HKO95_08020 [Rhodobacteraceae bacterium]|nr:hypothetical protein [Alphaproteobacteria bacterium]MBT8475992.1 hypothetical protein [Alphaproteobacteria bacterium]NNK66668.1 hypothetical protein [Paracoccaceae bacterium]